MDAGTGAFSVATLQDTNGDAGFSSLNGAGTEAPTIVVSGDTLTLTMPGGEFFLAIYLAEDGPIEEPDAGRSGIEKGTYSWDPVTGVATLLTTLDTDGAALAELDSNEDGVFDAEDAAYARMHVWIDINHDRRSQTRELIGLDKAGITRVSLGYTVSDLVDRFGNRFFFKGTALVRNQRGVALPTIIYDVVFAGGDQ